MNIFLQSVLVIIPIILCGFTAYIILNHSKHYINKLLVIDLLLPGVIIFITLLFFNNIYSFMGHGSPGIAVYVAPIIYIFFIYYFVKDINKEHKNETIKINKLFIIAPFILSIISFVIMPILVINEIPKVQKYDYIAMVKSNTPIYYGIKNNKLEEVKIKLNSKFLKANILKELVEKNAEYSNNGFETFDENGNTIENININIEEIEKILSKLNKENDLFHITEYDNDNSNVYLIRNEYDVDIFIKEEKIDIPDSTLTPIKMKGISIYKVEK